MVRIAVLVSGRGSNLQAIINSIENKKINAVIAVVISDVQNALALEIAKEQGIKTLFVDSSKFKTRKDFDQNIIEIIKREQATLICLAGFMRVLSETFVKQFKNRIMNIHPSFFHFQVFRLHPFGYFHFSH